MSDDKIIPFTGLTSQDIPADRVLKEAGKAGLSEAVVIGWDEEGGLYFAGSRASGPSVLGLLEVAKKALLSDE